MMSPGDKDAHAVRGVRLREFAMRSRRCSRRRVFTFMQVSKWLGHSIFTLTLDITAITSMKTFANRRVCRGPLRHGRESCPARTAERELASLLFGAGRLRSGPRDAASTHSSPHRRVEPDELTSVTASLPELPYRWPIGASSLHSIVRQMVSLAPVCGCRGALVDYLHGQCRLTDDPPNATLTRSIVMRPTPRDFGTNEIAGDWRRAVTDLGSGGEPPPDMDCSDAPARSRLPCVTWKTRSASKAVDNRVHVLARRATSAFGHHGRRASRGRTGSRAMHRADSGGFIHGRR